jgi:hypothetical protein
VVGEVGDLARPVPEAQDVVQEEVLQLVRADRRLGVLGSSPAGTSSGEIALSAIAERTAPASSPNCSEATAQRTRNRMSVLGTEALTL